MSITSKPFGTIPSGKAVTAYTMTSKCGISVTILDLGGIIQSINMPDKNGVVKDVVCGYDTPTEYLEKSGYCGALIGRYANRIKNGTFELNGVQYNVPKNEKGKTALHGGTTGFDKYVWDVSIGCCKCGADKLVLKLTSPDGDQGFPGKVEVTVVYLLTDDGEFTIKYKAVADKETPIAMTNHAYFNMAGYDTQSVLEQTLKLNCSKIVAIDNDLIPTDLLDVTDTAFDFREPKLIGKDIASDHDQIAVAGGYDHTFVIDNNEMIEWKNGLFLSKCAELSDTASGRKVTVYTDAPGIQIYSGNFMGDGATYKNNVSSVKHGAICLETGFYPDTPNRPDFPSCIYGPDKNYECTAVFKFSIEE